MVNVDAGGDLPVSVAVVPTQFTGAVSEIWHAELSISEEGIAIKAFDKTGAFYAVQSILA
ncbi:hypothetical protein OK016_13825 [Vibrio chagasii]|nr:hypothetical protein [Vibrio chagasii]